uniref:Hyaluronidase n=1 Tax=Branchiostoma floridae TaxID=7739 RepID=C3XRM6_BRAFL|eukprot:XP_002613335.1 hypothetical protein BRAFLDRAFT_68302 [Branchiostoma floridae]
MMTVEFSLDEYDIVSNPGQEWNGTYVTIFYEKNLGLYPKIHEQTGQDINGGIPQRADIDAHLAKATDDIYRLIPDADYQGLGVIDFKPWRPLWKRNLESKSIYRTKSEDLVRQTSPHVSEHEVTSMAKVAFEGAARAWMGDTLSLVKTLRPRGSWGFYLFPDCYNSPSEIQLREGSSYDCTETDMVSTIQEAAGQGSAGVVIWGASADVSSKENCLSLRDYVTTIFGPFAKEMMKQAAECSRRECSNNGRCVTAYERPSLDAQRKTKRFGNVDQGIQRVVQTTQESLEGATSQGQQSNKQFLSSEHATWFSEGLQYLTGRQGTSCRCYPGWAGERCSVSTHKES